MPSPIYDSSSLSRMVSAITRVLPEAQVDAEGLSATLDDLFNDLGWRQEDKWAEDFADAAASHPLGASTTERRAYHRVLASRYEARARAENPLAPDLINDEMRSAPELGDPSTQSHPAPLCPRHDSIGKAPAGPASSGPPRRGPDSLAQGGLGTCPVFIAAWGPFKGRPMKAIKTMCWSVWPSCSWTSRAWTGDLRDLDRGGTPAVP